jgi:LuxR family maltose regulon positive regulatory protein
MNSPPELLGPPSFAFEAVASRAITQLTQAEPLPRLVAVSAAPGYGKSVLLGTLYRALARRGMRCLWLALDERDAGLSALLFRLREALAAAGVPLSREMAGPKTVFHDRTAPVDAMVRLVTRLPGQTALFVDNLGFCVDEALQPFLDRLVFEPESGLHLVLSSTAEIPVDLARAKLELGAIDIRARHLSLDRDGIATLLGRAGIRDVPERELDQILARTEGWPAAVRLLQVLLSSEGGAAGGDASSVVNAALNVFGGEQRDVTRVLTQRVLRGFPPEVVQFMVELSLVREFSVELAMHISRRVQAQEWLEMLVSRCVLTFPLDSRRRWFRFHTLMREFLLAEADARIDLSHRRELLERAARWHAERSDHASAIDLALDAGAIELAHDLLDRVASMVVGDQGQMSTFVRWVDRLTAAGGRPSYQTHAWFFWALSDSLQYERARLALDEFDARAAADPSFALERSLPGRLMFLRMLMNVFTDRLEMAHQQATEWLGRGEQADALTMATVISIAAIAEIEHGDLSKALTRMQQARSVIDRSQSAYGDAWVGILTASIEIGRARPNSASAVLTETRERVVRAIGEDAGVVVTLDFAHARALVDLGRLSEAKALISRSLQRSSRHGILTSLEQGLIACVSLGGGPESDESESASLYRIANSYPSRGVCLLAASRARRFLALGRLDAAREELERARAAFAAHPPGETGIADRGEWLLARLEFGVAEGACESILDQIEGLLKTAISQGRERDRVEMLLVATDAQERLGRQRSALRHFALAVALATPGRLVQPFFARQSLLARLSAVADAKTLGLIQPNERDFLDRLFAETPRGGELGHDAGSDDQLTARQLQLLSLIDEGMSNEQVADRMSLSVTTVKWHLHNAYTKLGVRNRSAALARARALKLIAR